MDEVNRFLDVTEHFPFASGSEKGKQNSKWQIHSWSCIHWPWQRDGLCAHVPELAPEITSSLGFCMR